jgi:hypothetical protein
MYHVERRSAPEQVGQVFAAAFLAGVDQQELKQLFRGTGHAEAVRPPVDPHGIGAEQADRGPAATVHEGGLRRENPPVWIE